jgi:hypothetical protein
VLPSGAHVQLSTVPVDMKQHAPRGRVHSSPMPSICTHVHTSPTCKHDHSPAPSFGPALPAVGSATAPAVGWSLPAVAALIPAVADALLPARAGAFCPACGVLALPPLAAALVPAVTLAVPLPALASWTELEPALPDALPALLFPVPALFPLAELELPDVLPALPPLAAGVPLACIPELAESSLPFLLVLVALVPASLVTAFFALPLRADEPPWLSSITSAPAS